MMTERFIGVLLLLLGWSTPLRADLGPAPDGGLPRDGGNRAAEPTALPVPSPAAAALLEQAKQIRRLQRGQLDATVDPATLFDVVLTDEAVLRVEVARLEALLRPEPPPLPPAPVAVKADAGPPLAPRPADSGVAGGTAPDAAQPPAAPAPAPDPDPELWQARLELDRARLEFYRLPRERRQLLVLEHEARHRADAETRAAVELARSQQRAQAAREAERRAREAAERTRSEAARAVSEEQARLLGIASAQAEFEARIAAARQALEQRTNHSLGLTRRVRERLERRTAQTEPADPLHDELRAWLRASRDELSQALSMTRSRVPRPGEDRLANLRLEVDRSQVQALRRQLDGRAVLLEQAAERLGTEQRRQLYDDVRTLNRLRLELLPHLSRDRRGELLGFGWHGFDQAMAELRQISLVQRYHLAVTLRWLGTLLEGRDHASAVTSSIVGLLWLVVLVLFWQLRRRSGPLLARWEQELREEERRSGGRIRNRGGRWLDLLRRVRRPLEWNLLVLVLYWLLPARAQDQLEVQVLLTAANWILGGFFLIQVLDAVVALQQSPADPDGPARTDTTALRRRSLEFVGYTVVLFGLILSVTNLLVGQGTIYDWVYTFCWFAVVPVFLLLVRWWRDVIFERFAQLPHKTPFVIWVDAHHRGWRSVIAAMAGGIYLFVHGLLRFGSGWLNRIEMARQLHAYWYRRDMDRRASQTKPADLQPLPDAQTAALGPETAAAELIDGSAASQVAKIIERVNRVGGGLFAVVGERGAGKSTVLQRVAAILPPVRLINCPVGGLEPFLAELARVGELDPGVSLPEAAALLDVPEDNRGLLVDDAQHLIRPVIGGLAAFDEVLAAAREHSRCTAWFFVFDESLWRFIERSRGARPLFDDVVHLHPWQEEEIALLLAARCRQAGIEPHFDRLLPELPSRADEWDRAEARRRAAAGFRRMLWAAAGGNPGVALHLWQRSLGVDGAGRVQVRLCETPELDELEELPERSEFVLRAVLQLQPVLPAELAQASGLGLGAVEQLLRYGLTRGWFRQEGARYRVTWDWLRSITLFLRRRHLLSGGQ